MKFQRMVVEFVSIISQINLPQNKHVHKGNRGCSFIKTINTYPYLQVPWYGIFVIVSSVEKINTVSDIKFYATISTTLSFVDLKNLVPKWNKTTTTKIFQREKIHRNLLKCTLKNISSVTQERSEQHMRSYSHPHICS